MRTEKIPESVSKQKLDPKSQMRKVRDLFKISIAPLIISIVVDALYNKEKKEKALNWLEMVKTDLQGDQARFLADALSMLLQGQDYSDMQNELEDVYLETFNHILQQVPSDEI
jgi:hypothetical protein